MPRTTRDYWRPKKVNTQLVQTRIPDETFARLKVLAQKEGRSLASYIRSVLLKLAVKKT
jgi:predicted DNA-binding protein